MSFIGSTLGIGGASGNSAQGASGINYQAAQAPLQNPTNTWQANDAYNGAQSGLTQQQSFLNALQAQNGIGNQQNVYNQLQGVANGTGPNPAQAMLNQQTGANVAQQGALMASQRGAGANPALLARQAAMQGAATQQQAVGQGASMQAQQSLGALGQLGGIAGQQVGQQQAATQGLSAAQQSEQQNILNGIQGQNQASVSNTGSQNSANAGIANTAAQGQQGVVGGLLGATGTGASSLMKSGGAGAAASAEGGMAVKGGVRGQKGMAPKMQYADGGPAVAQPAANSLVQPTGGIQGASPQVSAAPTTSNTFKLLNSAPSNTSNSSASPQVSTAPAATTGAGAMQQGTQQFGTGLGSAIGNAFSSNPTPAATSAGGSQQSDYTGLSDYAGGNEADYTNLAKGGPVKALVSPGERYLPPKEVDKVKKGEKSPMKAGEKIPGKPKVGGSKNSYANDTVPKTLQEGGIVIPRSITQGKNPEREAHKFVSSIMAKQSMKKGAK